MQSCVLWSLPSTIPWATDRYHSEITDTRRSSDLFLRGRTFGFNRVDIGRGVFWNVEEARLSTSHLQAELLFSFMGKYLKSFCYTPWSNWFPKVVIMYSLSKEKRFVRLVITWYYHWLIYFKLNHDRGKAGRAEITFTMLQPYSGLSELWKESGTIKKPPRKNKQKYRG